MPERVKKMKCGGLGMAGKNWGGGVDHTKKSRGAVEKYVFFRGGGGKILNGIAQCK